MTVKVRRWGNSLGVRIAKPIAEGVHLREGTEVNVRLERGRIVVERVRAKPHYTLASLLAGLTPASRHEEVGTGAPAGREGW